MKKLVLSSSLILAFSLYILALPETPAVTDLAAVAVSPAKPVIAEKKVVSKTPVAPSKPIASLPPPKPAAVIPKPKPKGMYRDGSYTGGAADAYYGMVQVRAVIQNGRLADVQFLDHPQDRRTSVMINSQAMPLLISEAIQAQNANVDIVSGATATSGAFQESLANALAQAKA